ncbi:MAG: adenylate kinase [Prevotellaceae bacterium]|jgi:adenylate kinase|nr:adenylate kinase [Prevotellaceae bacterium]
MKTIVLFGAPGSGKGTLSALIAQEYNFMHLSTGDILRAETASKSDLGKLVDSYVSKGALVPDELIINILAKKIDKNIEAEGIILDGFPRTAAQAEALDEMLEKRGKKVDLMVDINVAEKTLFNRLVLRGATSGRADDTPETIKKRLNVYRKQTEPVKMHYKCAKRYFSADNNGSVEECFEQIKSLMHSTFNITKNN